jgi:ribosomal protein S18 acetylase RimI-like enzyme
MSLRITRAQAADLSDIVRLNGVVQDVHAALRPDIFRSDWASSALEQFWLERMTEPANTIALATIEDKPVGYIWFELQDRLRDALHHARRRIYVHHIAVDEHARRAGIGRKLLEYAEAEAKLRAISTMVLDAWASNSAAQDFFSARGYDPIIILRSRSWSC